MHVSLWVIILLGYDDVKEGLELLSSFTTFMGSDVISIISDMMKSTVVHFEHHSQND